MLLLVRSNKQLLLDASLWHYAPTTEIIPINSLMISASQLGSSQVSLVAESPCDVVGVWCHRRLRCRFPCPCPSGGRTRCLWGACHSPSSHPIRPRTTPAVRSRPRLSQVGTVSISLGLWVSVFLCLSLGLCLSLSLYLYVSLSLRVSVDIVSGPRSCFTPLFHLLGPPSLKTVICHPFLG